MSVSIKPLEDRIVIKQVEAEQTTASGLVIPDTAKEKPQEGEVVAVGPGRIDDNGNRVPLDVAVGDKVIYSKYGGTEVKYGGDDCSCCRPATCSRSSSASSRTPMGGAPRALPGAFGLSAWSSRNRTRAMAPQPSRAAGLVSCWPRTALGLPAGLFPAARASRAVRDRRLAHPVLAGVLRSCLTVTQGRGGSAIPRHRAVLSPSRSPVCSLRNWQVYVVAVVRARGRGGSRVLHQPDLHGAARRDRPA